MKLEELLAGREHCSCGKSHKCPIDRVIIGENACESLTELAEKYRHILLAADTNTYEVCGEKVRRILGGKTEHLLIYRRSSVLVPDETAIEEMKQLVTPETDLIVGVGSGVINDICKCVSFQCGLRYFIVATAPSMDGYASKGAAMILGGMKVTLTANVPKAIVADINVLKDAPFPMIQSGYGDIIGKYSCLNDWKLSAAVNGEYLCREVMDATYEEVEKTVRLAEGLVRRDASAVGTLMEALVAVGILMAYVGNSRPASGSEHHMSHYFEIVGLVRGEPYFPHGIDVCYSAVDTAKMREQLLSVDEIDRFTHHFDPVRYESEIRRIYTGIADEVLNLQKRLGWYEIDRVRIYREKWQEIRKILADCPSSLEMRTLVEKIGLSYDGFEELYGKQKIEDAHWYAKDLKDRYTVLWMYDDLFRQ